MSTTSKLPSNVPNTPAVQAIMQKFVTDPKFRAGVLDDPTKALAGMSAPPELIQFFEGVDPETAESDVASLSTDDQGSC